MLLTTRSPITIRPVEISSSPASRRSPVVLRPPRGEEEYIEREERERPRQPVQPPVEGDRVAPEQEDRGPQRAHLEASAPVQPEPRGRLGEAKVVRAHDRDGTVHQRRGERAEQDD